MTSGETASAHLERTGQPLVRLTGIVKHFGRLQVLRGVDLEVWPGEVVVLIGPSGSGKTTLLRSINHLEEVDGGSVVVDGQMVGYQLNRRGNRLHPSSSRQIARVRMDIGMVFQSFNLFPHMTVLENIIEAPVKIRREPSREAEAHAMELLDRVGLADKRDGYPRQLSGGQQQRVAIVRALAMRPRLMLLDEVTSALDPELVADVLDVIRELAEGGMTMLIATHEMGFARDIASRVCFLADGQIVEQAPPAQLFSQPSDERTRRFLRRITDAGRL